MKLELYSYDKKDIIDETNIYHVYLSEIESDYDRMEFIITFKKDIEKKCLKDLVTYKDYLVFNKLSNSYKFINEEQFNEYYYHDEYSETLFIFDLREDINKLYLLDICNMNKRKNITIKEDIIDINLFEDDKLLLITDFKAYIKQYIKNNNISPVGVTIIYNNALNSYSGPSGEGPELNLYNLFKYYFKYIVNK